jgi:predicted RNA-binding Zn ribbon-like protein
MTAPFQLFGGHPALDLVNTLDNRFVPGGPLELLPTYAALLRFVSELELLNPAQIRRLEMSADASAAARVLEGVRTLREALAALCYRSSPAAGVAADAIRVIEGNVLEADGQRRLLVGKRSPRAKGAAAAWSWHPHEGRPELPLWILSKAAETLVTTELFAQVGFCQRDSCRWLFLDSSRNHSRRWCDMRVCGNRVKAQRFQAKRRR